MPMPSEKLTTHNRHFTRPNPSQLTRRKQCLTAGMAITVVFDCWNGYHSVPFRTDDWRLTTFITPWGWYRYKVAPQRYVASGDGYMDEITSDISDKTTCMIHYLTTWRVASSKRFTFLICAAEMGSHSALEIPIWTCWVWSHNRQCYAMSQISRINNTVSKHPWYSVLVQSGQPSLLRLCIISNSTTLLSLAPAQHTIHMNEWTRPR